MPDTAEKPARRWTFAAAIVAIIGLMILTISGLCTGIMGIGMLYSIVTEAGSLNSATISGLLSGLGMVAVVGGIPIVIGLLITRAGFGMRKKD